MLVFCMIRTHPIQARVESIPLTLGIIPFSYSVQFIDDFFVVEIGKCKNLSGVSLQHNELTSLPESIGDLSLLERLGIR